MDHKLDIIGIVDNKDHNCIKGFNDLKHHEASNNSGKIDTFIIKKMEVGNLRL